MDPRKDAWSVWESGQRWGWITSLHKELWWILRLYRTRRRTGFWYLVVCVPRLQQFSSWELHLVSVNGTWRQQQQEEEELLSVVCDLWSVRMESTKQVIACTDRHRCQSSKSFQGAVRFVWQPDRRGQVVGKREGMATARSTVLSDALMKEAEKEWWGVWGASLKETISGCRPAVWRHETIEDSRTEFYGRVSRDNHQRRSWRWKQRKRMRWQHASTSITTLIEGSRFGLMLTGTPSVFRNWSQWVEGAVRTLQIVKKRKLFDQWR